MKLPGRDVPWKTFFKDLSYEWSKDRVSDVAGSVTFFGVLAIFPFMLFLVSLASLIIDPRSANTLVDQLSGIAPPQVTEILASQLQELGAGRSPGLLTLGALGAIWAASSGMVALMQALNIAYDVEESRSFFKKRLIAVGMVLLAAAIALAATGIAIIAAPVLNAIGGTWAQVLLWLRLPVAALLMMFLWATLYWALPDVEQKFKFVSPGSILGVLVWALASWGFSVYVTNFGNYASTYGALGGVIVMLLWMWITAQMLLLGAEINAILEHYSPEGKRAGAKSLDDTGESSKGEGAERERSGGRDT
ncbi:MAG: YihY/virulence factor BrkB family protein, partial [Myxococcales bacterium]